MKTKLSKEEAEKKIHDFFKKENFSKKEVRKIKRLAMHYNIKLINYRKLFCKSCLSKLQGKTRITKTHKTIICKHCYYKNKFRMK